MRMEVSDQKNTGIFAEKIASLHQEYYGCADTVTGLAFGYIDEILDFTKKNSII